MERAYGDPSKLAVGDRVTTEFEWDCEDVVRTVTALARSDRYGSGWSVSMSAGEPCETCGAVRGTAIYGVDGAWAVPCAAGGAKPAPDACGEQPGGAT